MINDNRLVIGVVIQTFEGYFSSYSWLGFFSFQESLICCSIGVIPAALKFEIVTRQQFSPFYQSKLVRLSSALIVCAAILNQKVKGSHL